MGLIITVFVLVTSVNDEDYTAFHWPKLENAILLILQQNPGQFIPISYEEMYRYVCVYLFFIKLARLFLIEYIYISCSYNKFTFGKISAEVPTLIIHSFCYSNSIRFWNRVSMKVMHV